MTDYSVQQEHRRPWVNLIVPKALLREEDRGTKREQGEGKIEKEVESAEEVLMANGDRLMTGYDLHKTLLSLIVGGGGGGGGGGGCGGGGDDGGGGGGGVGLNVDHLSAPWAYNLIHDAIPLNRSCKDANIPLDFCAW